MESENKLKIILGIIYLSIVTGFLLLFFSYFSFDDFSSFELIKNNRDKLNDIKNSNLLIASLLFFIGVIIWVMLLGFGSPVFLVGGFIFGKWIGTIPIVFGLSIGATLLYISVIPLLYYAVSKSKINNLEIIVLSFLVPVTIFARAFHGLFLLGLICYFLSVKKNSQKIWCQ